jgi:hypothetical protein
MESDPPNGIVGSRDLIHVAITCDPSQASFQIRLMVLRTSARAVRPARFAVSQGSTRLIDHYLSASGDFA